MRRRSAHVMGGILACLFLLVFCGRAEALSFFTYAGEDKGDGTFETPAMVQGAAGVSAFQAEIIYDPSILEVADVQPGALFDGLIDFNVVEPGRAKVALATTQAISGDGEILKVVCNIVGSGAATVTLDNCKAWGEDGQELDILSSDDFANVAKAQSMARKIVPLLVMAAFLFVFLAAGVVLVLILRSRKKTDRSGVAPRRRAPVPPPIEMPEEPPTLIRPPPPPVPPPVRPPVVEDEDLDSTQPLPVFNELSPRATPDRMQSKPNTGEAPRSVPKRSDASTCPACAQELPADARFCPGCGAPVKRTCPGCQEPLSADAKFCPGCGRRVTPV